MFLLKCIACNQGLESGGVGGSVKDITVLPYLTKQWLALLNVESEMR